MFEANQPSGMAASDLPQAETTMDTPALSAVETQTSGLPQFELNSDPEPDICAPEDRGRDIVPCAVGETALEKTAPPDPDTETDRDIITDRELAENIVRAADAASPENVDKLLRANARFSTPVVSVSADDTETVDNHYHDKAVLKEVPGLIEAASRIQIPNEQTTDLATHTLDHVRYPRVAQPGDTMARLARAVESAGDAGETPPETIVEELKQLVSTASLKDAIDPALSSFAAARGAGLSVEDSTALVKDFINTGQYRQVGHCISRLRYALETLDLAGVSPDATKSVFKAMNDLHPENRRDTYDMFSDAVTFGCPRRNITAAEFVNSIAEQVSRGVDVTDAIVRTIGFSEQASISGEHVSDIIVPKEQIERRFPERTGPLEHAALAYQTKRSLNEGVRDLEHLTNAEVRRGETVSEGVWVYDPSQGKWYSLGGETEVLPQGARHTYVPIDLSQLSDRPHQFHIHPRQAGIMVDRYSLVFPTGSDYYDVAQQMDNMSRPVELRSFISHPLGITEFGYPASPEMVRNVAAGIDSLKSAIWQSIAPDEYKLLRLANTLGEQGFAAHCVETINKCLPPGFQIRWYPRGTDLEQVIRQQQTGLKLPGQ